ncbi:hypothetical protein K525DRAFT_151296, partial [Schizophyllum commune Loenen D]
SSRLASPLLPIQPPRIVLLRAPNASPVPPACSRYDSASDRARIDPHLDFDIAPSSSYPADSPNPTSPKIRQSR